MTEMTEQKYLEAFDPSSFPGPLVIVDATLFTYHDETLKVLLVKRANHPERGKWALPGGFIHGEEDNTLDDAVRRVLRDKTGITPPYVEQLATYGDKRRDARGWSVTICYSALIAHSDCAEFLDNVTDTRWAKVETLRNSSLAFDHKRIVTDARERLRQKALYSIVPAFALPERFTLPELQGLHEALIGKTLQKKSFRRRIEQAGLLEEAGSRQSDVGRPATLYRMKPRSGAHTFLRNLEA